MESLPNIFVFLVPIVGAVALFSFLAVVGYAEERRKEREAHYRYEFRKKLVEHGGANSSQLMDLLKEEEAGELRRRREGLKLGGLVTAGVGVGVMFGLTFIGAEDVWKVGFIPFAIGVAILVYALWLAPRPSGQREGPPAP